MIPWLIGAAVVGIVAAITSDDDDSSSLANTIKRVVKSFWQAVKEAFIESIGLNRHDILAARTFYDKRGYRPKHINDEYFRGEDLKLKRKRRVIEEEDEDIDESELSPDLRAEMERNEAELTSKRRKLTNTYY